MLLLLLLVLLLIVLFASGVFAIVADAVSLGALIAVAVLITY